MPRPARILAALVLALGFLIRLQGLELKGFWLDEAAYTRLAELSPGALMAQLRHDVHPPLYFMLLKVWQVFTPRTDFSIRMLSVLFGSLTIGVMMRIGRELGGDRTGLIAGSLLALSPVHAWYSQEAKSYSLFLLLASVSYFWFIRLDKGPSARQLCGYAISTASMLYSHNASLFVLAAQLASVTAGVLAERRISAEAGREKAVQYLKAGMLVFLLYLPWIGTVIHQSGNLAHNWIPMPTPSDVFRVAHDHFSSPSHPDTGLSHLSAGLGLISIFLVCLSPPRSDTSDRWELARIMIPWLSIPLLLPFASSFLSGPVFLFRVTLPMHLGLILLMALGLAKLTSRFPIRGLSLALLILGTQAIQIADARRHATWEEWREAAAYLGTSMKPGEALVVDSWQYSIPMRWYLESRGISVVEFKPGATELPVQPAPGRGIWLLACHPSSWVRELLQSEGGRYSVEFRKPFRGQYEGTRIYYVTQN